MLHLDVACIFVPHVNLFMKDVIHASPQTPLHTGHLMDDPLLSLDNADTTMAVEKITTTQNTSSNCSLYAMLYVLYQLSILQIHFTMRSSL